MNTNHDELERLLGDELNDRAGDIGGARLHLNDVRRRASRIRRTRRIASGVVAAAVVALAVPVGLSVADSMKQTSPPVAPSPDPEPAPTPQADGSFLLTIEGLPEGDPAEIGYVRIDDRELVMPAGAFDLPDAYPEILPYGADGWLALRTGDYAPLGYQVAELTEDFDVVTEAPAGPGIIVSGNHGSVAWVEVEGGRSVLVSKQTDGRDATRTDVGAAGAQPVGFLRDGNVLLSLTDQQTGEMTTLVAQPGGGVSELPGFISVYDGSDVSGLVAGQTEYREDGTSCAGVMSEGEMLWKTCDYTLGQFSPDGRYVVGLASQFDGPGSPTLSILDAYTGEPLVDFRPTADDVTGVDQVDWEDNDTVLATVTQGRDQALLRAELNGRLELVDGPIRTSGLEVEFWLAEYPFG